MQLDQLIPDASLSRVENARIQPFVLDELKEAFELNDTALLNCLQQRRELLPLCQYQKLSQKTRTGSIENIETRTRRKIGNIRKTRIKTRIETERRKEVDTMLVPFFPTNILMAKCFSISLSWDTFLEIECVHCSIHQS